jgi:hypothetical protein
MKSSIAYLYAKQKDVRNDFLPRYATEKDLDSFMDNIYDSVDYYSEKTGRSVKINSQIKHLVVAFHPKDQKKFDNDIANLVTEILDHLEIDAENHGLTAFVHGDTAHPHVHLAFSRLGTDGTAFNDNKLGWRLNDIAKRMDLKHDLTRPEKNKIVIRSKYLYKPTSRGDLLKLIKYASQEANSLTEFQKIMQEHSVFARKTKTNKFVYITNSKLAFKEERLPNTCRLEHLYQNIKTTEHDKTYITKRKLMSELIGNCNTLDDLKAILPGSEIFYQREGDQIFNVTIKTEEDIIKLEDFFTKNIVLTENNYLHERAIPVTFTNYRINDWDIEHQKFLAKKYGKRAYQLGFKIQLT